jgi:hypothetical protein
MGDWFLLLSALLIISLTVKGVWPEMPPRQKFLWVTVGGLACLFLIVGTISNALTHRAEQQQADNDKRVLGDKVNALYDQIKELSQKAVQSSDVVGRIAHFQFNAQQIASSDPNLPFALQFVILTDQTIEKPAFIVTCDGQISKGNFFIPGQVIYTLTQQLITDDKKSFGFRFATPSFDPNAPLIVTLFSTNKIRCDKLTDARQIQFQIHQ